MTQEHRKPPEPAATAPAELERLRLAAIIDSSDDGIVSKDLDGTIRSWNPAAERIFGYPAEEMVGDSIFKLIPPELHEEENGLLARIRAGEHIAHYETERIRKDGRRIRVALTLSPLVDSAGRLIGASAIKRDVTAQRALEVRLQQAQRMEAVGRLAGGIAHDFNNLLTVIGGMSALLRPHLPEAGRPRQNLEQILVATERAAALTQQLLTFSRRQLAEVEVVDLSGIAGAMVALLRPILGEQIRLDVRLGPADVATVRGNRAQLEQVVMNLAINARDAMPDGGRLTIETGLVRLHGPDAQERLQLEPGPYVALTVSDTGEGIDPATQASIFEPFFTTKPAGQGTGLGLATVYAIVEQAGGGIQVASTPGQGATFTVYLPFAGTPAEAPLGMEPSAHPGNQLPREGSILLVEDEDGVRSLVAQVLEDAGYRVVDAASGEEALGLARASDGHFDLLLTDVVMSGMNGRVLARHLQAGSPELRVLYMSGYTDDMVVRAGVAAEGAAFLPKPFTPETLLERVRAMLPSPGSRSAAAG